MEVQEHCWVVERWETCFLKSPHQMWWFETCSPVAVFLANICCCCVEFVLCKDLPPWVSYTPTSKGCKACVVLEGRNVECTLLSWQSFFTLVGMVPIEEKDHQSSLLLMCSCWKKHFLLPRLVVFLLYLSTITNSIHVSCRPILCPYGMKWNTRCRTTPMHCCISTSWATCCVVNPFHGLKWLHCKGWFHRRSTTCQLNLNACFT